MTTVAIGLDVGGTSCKGALVTPDGVLLERHEVRTETQAATKTIIDVAEHLFGRAMTLDLAPVGFGIGVAGFVDFASGSVTFSPNLVYDDPDIAAALSARFAEPVVVDNDANAAVWGERSFGAARGHDDVALLTLGTGIGSGFIVDGRLLRGSSGAGAEFGHVVVDPTGPDCPCGLKGCLERFASGGAIGAWGREEAAQRPGTKIAEVAGGPELITGEHVSRAAAFGDETALAILRRAGRFLGIGLANLVNVFDPEIIVLAGSATEAGEPFLGVARDELARRLAAQRRRPARLDISSLGDDMGILGAAALAFDHALGGDRR
jgi:glucokinase